MYFDSFFKNKLAQITPAYSLFIGLKLKLLQILFTAI